MYCIYVPVYFVSEQAYRSTFPRELLTTTSHKTDVDVEKLKTFNDLQLDSVTLITQLSSLCSVRVVCVLASYKLQVCNIMAN